MLLDNAVSINAVEVIAGYGRELRRANRKVVRRACYNQGNGLSVLLEIRISYGTAGHSWLLKVNIWYENPQGKWDIYSIETALKIGVCLSSGNNYCLHEETQ